MASKGYAGDELHALMVALPAPGHMNPLLELAFQLISTYGVKVTLVHCEGVAPLVAQRFRASSASQHLRCVAIPGMKPSKGMDISLMARSLEDLILNMGLHLDRIMQDLALQNHAPSCIISDTYIRVAQDIAHKFNIPKVDFCHTSASYFSLNLHISSLISQGHIPLQDCNVDPALAVSIPGLPPLLLGEIPKQFLVSDLSDLHFQTLVKPFARIREASHVLANTFYELESNAIDSLNKSGSSPLVLPIGPLLCSTVLCADDNLKWMDTRPPSSVLYAAFGTLFPLPPSQIQEVAYGLEASEESFLWVLSTHEMSSLPEGFLDRTHERGLVVSWVNQQAVLSHPAAGGFLSHCGWNSIIESIYFGVPMLCLPLESDQTFNFKFILEEWKIGIGFGKREDGFVGRKSVEKAVRGLMQKGEIGEALRQRARELSDAARRAKNVDGGSSRKNLDVFVEDMRIHHAKK